MICPLCKENMLKQISPEYGEYFICFPIMGCGVSYYINPDCEVDMNGPYYVYAGSFFLKEDFEKRCKLKAFW